MIAVPKNKLWKTKINVKAYPKHEHYSVRVTANIDITKPIGVTIEVTPTGYVYSTEMSIGSMRAAIDNPRVCQLCIPYLTDDMSVSNVFYVGTFDRKFFSSIYDYMKSEDYIKDCLAGTCDIEQRIEDTIAKAKVKVRELIAELVEKKQIPAFWYHRLGYTPVAEIIPDSAIGHEAFVEKFRRQFNDFESIALFKKALLESPIEYKWGPLSNESDAVKVEYKDTRIYNV